MWLEPQALILALAHFVVDGHRVTICLFRSWLFFLVAEFESWVVEVNQTFYKVSSVLDRFNRLIFIQKFAAMNYRVPNLIDLF